MLRSLIHYWRIHLAVALGAAVATAVLAGALLVGDSTKESLKALTLERLGQIHHALVGESTFRVELADELAEGGNLATAPVMLLNGALTQPDRGSRASKVSIQGIDERFGAFFGAELDLSRRSGQIYPSAIVNESLRRELGAEIGDALLLSFGRYSNVPRETLMGEKDPDEVLSRLRLTLVDVVPDEGVGRFGLAPHQQSPFNVFLEIGQLQRRLERRGEANAVLLGPSEAPLEPLLQAHMSLADLGLEVDGIDSGELQLESRSFLLRDDLDERIRRLAADLGAPLLGVSSYLANGFEFGERETPYSGIVGFDRESAGAPWPRLEDGRPAPDLSENGVLLNRWAADDLGVTPGDSIVLRYFEVGAREELRERETTLTVEGVIPMDGLGADPLLTPDYPGIQDSDDMAAWDPPFPVELDKIRDKDEDYWDDYRAAPKAFIRGDTARELWASRFGSTTALRIGPIPGKSLAETREALVAALRSELTPETLGFRLLNVRDEGLSASGGATDFGQLFLAFSFFLIISASLLVALMFSLGVEQRAGQLGVRLATGFPRRSITRSLLAEGFIVACVGALLGLAGGVAYAAGLMAALRTLWVGAVGSSRLYLHVFPQSLVIGWVIAVLVVLLSIYLAVRRLRRIATPSLLAGNVRPRYAIRKGKLAPLLALVGTIGGLGLLGLGLRQGASASPGISFGSGALLLIAGLALFALWCRGSGGRRVGGPAAWLGIAARNSSWNPGRSMLSVALVASACFVIVTVAAVRHEPGEELQARDSGAGGFALIAESDVPLLQDLNREEDRTDLGFDSDDVTALEGATVYPLRLLPGEDASCLNLYQPEKPKVLGATRALIERGGFGFKGAAELPEGTDNPWELLQQDLGPGVIPAFADANSAQWILKVGLGDDVELQDELGGTVKLRLVGTFERSILQSEMIVGEEAFLEHFPSREGYRAFLIDAPFERTDEVGRALESRLAEFGFDSTPTPEKMAEFLLVENTYLSTFQLLGGLGLLLGTIGLAIILVRNLIERRGELATLRAFGFRRSSLGWLVLLENVFLLAVGMVIGSGSALLGVAPRLAEIHADWSSLFLTLLAIFLVGMLASVVAVAGALRIPLLPALKAEG